MNLPKWWTECHEEVERGGNAAPCDRRPVVALRADLNGGEASDPRSWYPVCEQHVRAPMVDLWDVLRWATGPRADDSEAGLADLYHVMYEASAPGVSGSLTSMAKYLYAHGVRVSDTTEETA